MRFDWLGKWGMVYFEWPQRRLGQALLALYALLFVVLFVQNVVAYRRRRLEFKGKWLRWIAWLALWLVLGAVLANVLVLEWPAAHLPREFGKNRDAIAFAIYVPIVLAAAQLGSGPAMLVGMVAGWVSGAYGSGRLFEIFELGMLGQLSCRLLYQDYKGRVGAFLRQPLVAVPLAGVTIWILSTFSLLAYTDPSLSVLSALDVTETLAVANLPVVLIHSFGAGAVLQAAYALWPRMRAVQDPRTVPPYGRTISLRFLYVFLPASIILLFAVLYAVMAQALSTAVDQSIEQIDHVAGNVSADLPFFSWTGQSLLTGLALDDDLQSAEYEKREASLARGIKTMPFFSQIMLVERDDPDRIPRTIVPNPQVSQRGLVQLTAREARLLERSLRDGSPQVSPVHRNRSGAAMISFVVPVFNSLVPQEIESALIGRVYVRENYQLQSMLSNLQPPGTSETNRGVGFLIDDNNQIVAHPDSDRILETWQQNPDPFIDHEPRNPQSRVYEDMNGPERTRQLVYILATEGVPWRIVVIRPYETVLSQATEISRPLILLFLVGGLIFSLSVPIFTSRLTRPLQALTQAAREMARGRLDAEVQVPGDDEVGQLGRSFEQMRLRLEERMEESALLLDISRQVSASMELRPSLLPILNGVMRATGGLAARIVLVNERGRPDKSLSLGEEPIQEAMKRLDTAAEAVVKSNRAVIIEDLQSSPASPAELRDAGIRALIGIPLRLQDRVTGVLWVSHQQPHRFGEAELRFLNTLSGQAAVVAANAQLFEDVQEERSRLSAILSSTDDVVLAVDAQGTVLLCNPAAMRAYNILPSQVIGRPLDEAIADPVLRDLFARPMEAENALVNEVQAPGDRTFSASISALSGGGRVVTLRDITYLKELDQIKSDFVNTVSHDLRSPLTYMRGYTSMIPMAGPLTQKQNGFIERILSGIEQMTELIDDLLDIGRIEAGVGIQIEQCSLPIIVQAVVDDLGMRALENEVELIADLPRGLPPTLGDSTLIRQAIKNLVENAIKYTPGPGRVEVCLHAEPKSLVVSVHDNGVGIAPEDQHRLFEKFYRVRRRDTVHVRGTGLGLAIVKSIADLHGGRVWVESRLNQGSTFYLSVPLRPVTAETGPDDDLAEAEMSAETPR